MSKWPLVAIDDLVEDIIDRRGVTPIKLGSSFTAIGHRVISAKLIKSGAIDLAADEPRYVDERTYARWMRSPLRADDVILTSEAPLGEVAYLGCDVDWVLGQRLFALRSDKRRLHGRWLYYALQTDPSRSDLQSRATGTTAQGIRQTELRRVRIPLPPLTEQRRIADILGALDDKIELNRRVSETLQSTARALFHSWFVVGAVTEADGWRPSVIGREFDVTMGQSPPGSTYNSIGDGLPFYQGRADFGTRFPTRRIHCSAPTRTARAGDTLLSVRAPVGDVNIATEQCAIGRGLAAIRHRGGSRTYTFEFMNSMRAVLDEFNAHGTVFGAIGGKDLSALPCVAPPDALVRDFEDQARPIDDRLENLERQRHTLREVRDALLPRLLSGALPA